MTPAEFMEKWRMLYSLVREITKDGVPAGPENSANHRAQ